MCLSSLVRDVWRTWVFKERIDIISDESAEALRLLCMQYRHCNGGLRNARIKSVKLPTMHERAV